MTYANSSFESIAPVIVLTENVAMNGINDNSVRAASLIRIPICTAGEAMNNWQK